MSRFNSFQHIVGYNKLARHTPTLNSNFFGKLRDAYYAMYGKNAEVYQDATLSQKVATSFFGLKSQFGLLDYATLLIDPLLSLTQQGISRVFAGIKRMHPVPRVIFSIIPGLPLFAVRLALGVVQIALRVVTGNAAIALTIGTSLITGVVAAISHGVKRSLQKRAGKLTLNDEPNEVKLSEANANGLGKLSLRAVNTTSSTKPLFDVLLAPAVVPEGRIIDADTLEAAPVTAVRPLISTQTFTFDDIKKPKNDDAKAVAAMVKLNYKGMADKVSVFAPAPARNDEEAQARRQGGRCVRRREQAVDVDIRRYEI